MLIDSYDYTKMAGKIVLDKAIMLLNEFTKNIRLKFYYYIVLLEQCLI